MISWVHAWWLWESIRETKTSLVSFLSSDTSVSQSSSSVQGTKDLSELRSRIRTRVAEITHRISSSSFGWIALGGSSSRIIDIQAPIKEHSMRYDGHYFKDIADDPYSMYIDRLSAYGVLRLADNFYPHNYLRSDDCLVLLQKILVKKYWNDTRLRGVEQMLSWSDFVTKWTLYQVLSTIEPSVSLSIDGDGYRFITRAEASFYIVRWFGIPPLFVNDNQKLSNISLFKDTFWHPYVREITILAQLGIVSSYSWYFYPDNYVRHYDFIIMLVNTLQYVQGSSLWSEYRVVFADVPMTASYYPHMAYAFQIGIMDPLIYTRWWSFYASPNAFITKQQIYTILKMLVPEVQFADEDQWWEEKITRWALAYLLVHIFNLDAAGMSSESTWLGEWTKEWSIWWTLSGSMFGELKKLLSFL